MSGKSITIRDSTLREGMDVPGVDFSIEQKLRIARSLDSAGVSEAEVVAPGRVLKDLEFVKALKTQYNLGLKTSGLIYSQNPTCKEEIEEASRYLDRFDLLMPVSLKRKPYDKKTKIRLLVEALKYALSHNHDIGVGFPNSTQTEPSFLLEIAKEAVKNGASRITIYDTNGSSDPFTVYSLIKDIKEELGYIKLFFHAHNDLGLATANSLAAVYSGADGLDVTVNGLGDRAGNASLEQVALNLYLKGFSTGIKLEKLKELSKTVEEESGITVYKLAPVIGDFVFSHKSPGHLEKLELFEAFDPGLVASFREISNP